MKKNFLGVLFLLLAAGCMISAAAQGGQNALIGGIAVGLIFVWLAVRSFRQAKPLRKAQQKSAPAAQSQRPAPQLTKLPDPPVSPYRFYSFKVKGVTFQNDDGTDRQTILRHLKFMDPPYIPEGQQTAALGFEPFTFEGSPALRITVNGYCIGTVPRENVQEVSDILRRPDMSAAYNIYGGRDGHSYGCEVSLRYTP